jgi:ribosomal protein S1
VTFEPCLDGLLHVPEPGKYKRINRPNEVLDLNQVIQVSISSADEGRNRIYINLLKIKLI